jgi:hypothetical protein
MFEGRVYSKGDVISQAPVGGFQRLVRSGLLKQLAEGYDPKIECPSQLEAEDQGLA